MLKIFLTLVLFFSGTVFAAEINNNVTLNFGGRVSKPSCQIKFDTGAVKEINFGKVNVSDLRYFINNGLGSDYSAQWTYSKYISSPIFNIEISQCSADELSADANGYQFTLGIEPASNAQWYITSDGNNAGYMDGGLTPLTGATSFAAKFLVPYVANKDTDVPENPTKWSVFTGEGITVRDQHDFIPATDQEAGPAQSAFKVSFAHLPQRVEGGGTTWLIPMKIKLGMTHIDANSGTSGAFSVSALITVAYY